MKEAEARCPMVILTGCGGQLQNVIYYGLPCGLCNNASCNCLVGPWWAEWLIDALPFNGVMMRYGGSYWPALWHWLCGPQEESHD